MNNLDDILTDEALDEPHCFVITDDVGTAVRLALFGGKEYCGAFCAVIPRHKLARKKR